MDRQQKRVLKLRDHVLKQQAQPKCDDKCPSNLTAKELKDKAKEKDILGYSTMKKKELIEALEGD